MDVSIIVLVSVFIGVAVILAISVSMFEGVSTTIDCNSLQGSNYNNTNPRSRTETTGYQTETIENSQKRHADRSPDTGWAKACFQQKLDSQGSLGLISVILIVVAAVTILVVVRLLY